MKKRFYFTLLVLAVILLALPGLTAKGVGRVTRHARRLVTASARRWVAVPEWVMAEISATCPPDDRTPERRVFQGLTPSGAKNAVT